MHLRLQVTYRIRCDTRSIDARASALAVEQSVEMPLTAISDEFVSTEIVGRVEAIREVEPGLFEVAISLAAATVGDDPGQLLNMLFGNSSLHEDVTLEDVELPQALTRRFAGPSSSRPSSGYVAAAPSPPFSEIPCSLTVVCNEREGGSSEEEQGVVPPPTAAVVSLAVR